MFSRLLSLLVFAVLVSAASIAAHAQIPDEFPDASTRSGRPRRDTPKGLEEMLAKQRAEREKKDHEEMLERGEEALRITKQLETSLAQNGHFSSQDRSRLESLEKVVEKIRKELGGDDDESSDGDTTRMKPADEPKPSTIEEGFKFLQSTTVKLVDELKKTTRFTISAVAIQTSNSVLKLVRFLRLRK